MLKQKTLNSPHHCWLRLLLLLLLHSTYSTFMLTANRVLTIFQWKSNKRSICYSCLLLMQSIRASKDVDYGDMRGTEKRKSFFFRNLRIIIWDFSLALASPCMGIELSPESDQWKWFMPRLRSVMLRLFARLLSPSSAPLCRMLLLLCLHSVCQQPFLLRVSAVLLTRSFGIPSTC